MSNQTYQHWKLDLDSDSILWLYFDKADTTTNTIDAVVINELETILDNLPAPKPRAVVIASAKKNGFIAGADIKQFTKFADAEAAMEFVRRGQHICNKLEALSVPTIAMIDGFCMGGGLELALACRYRIAEDGPKTKLGLPEILLGIHPGWGGTIRLPKLIGAPGAIELILSGRAVSAREAAKRGIVDLAVPKRQLKRAVRDYALRLPAPHKASWWQALTNAKPIRPLLGKLFQKQVAQRVRAEHYPAPYAVIDNWVKFGVHDAEAMRQEARSLASLIGNETAENLIRVFFLQEQLKSQGKGVEFKPRHVHVVGAGTMGAGIAAWCAMRGLQVSLQDQPEVIGRAIKAANDLFKKRLKLPRLVQESMDRLFPDPDGISVPKADVVIEAIYENLEAKQNLFAELEKRVKPDAILATNTSSIPLDEINRVLKNPERLVGIHFFNPVPKMLLVEVVQGDKTDPAILKKAIAFVRTVDRLPVPVKSKPGFLVNRMLMPYLMESMMMLEEGVMPQVIDRVALDFGMPMGPIELADTVGLDVCLYVAENLMQYYGGTIPERLRMMVANKQLGVKTGKGFYSYKKGKPVKDKLPEGDAGRKILRERMILRMLNEAAACLRENIVANDDLLDAGMIFGTGFAPFRGGPMHYAKTLGNQAIILRLNELQQQYGERFKPDSGWGA
jgi:3-hydroxyacyl-CoA dehydrogenase/enoyl-CoA hydratase/3-hydroxybutyryl-CoA epimerase